MSQKDIRITIEPGKDGIPHVVDIFDYDDALRTYDPDSLAKLRFQSGPRAEVGVNGFTADEVLKGLVAYSKAIVEKWPTAENEAQLASIEAALSVTQIRTKRREAAGVEGTSAKEV